MSSSSSLRLVLRAALGGVSAAVVLAAGLASAVAAPTATPTTSDQQVITQLIVAYEPGVAPSEAPGVATGADSVSSTTLETGDPIGFGLRTVNLGAPVDEATAEMLAAQLSQAPGVLYAQPDRIVTLAAIQPTPPWGLDRIDQASLPLDGTYQYQPSGSGAFDSSGSGVKAYVIDTGIRSTHNQFGGRVIAGYAGVADGNGTEDCNGHGTHVAGTIGGATYGVSKLVTLVPVRVFGCTGSTTISAVIAGVNWVVNDHVTGPAVANMSLSAGADTLLDAAVNALIDDGVTVVVASGNDAVDSCTKSPARVANAITVNASGAYLAAGNGYISDTTASFSNTGSCSDIYAPGVQIPSAWATSDTATNTISGTSMASPHVAGAAARLLGKDGTLSPAQVWSALSAAATNVAFAPAGGDPDKLLYTNPGILITKPTPPRSVGTTAGNASITVTWLTPTSNGGSPLNSYTARAWTASSGGSIQGSCQPSPLTDLGCTISAGLTNGTTYYVDVIAANQESASVGASDASAPRVSATPAAGLTVPSAPGSVSPIAGDASVTLTWLAPATNGGSSITSYTARAWTASSGGSIQGSCQPSPLTDLGCTISTGLANGTTYYVDAIATNAQGDSASSSPRVATMPAAVPGPPRSVAAAAGDTSAVLTWLSPTANGGSPVTSYSARAWTGASGGSIEAGCQPSPLTALTCVISGLANGTTYYVDVVAANAVGTGAAPASRTAVTPAAPAPSGGGGSSSSGSSGGGGGSAWTVKEVRPTSGSVSGGTRVLILGWGFTGATGVWVGGTPVTEFTFISDATLEIVTPPGTAGWQELRVWLPNGSVPAGFQYVADAGAPSTGGTPVVAANPVATIYIGPMTGGVIRPAVATAGQAPVTAYRRALSRSAAGASGIMVARQQVMRLRVYRLPSSTALNARVLVSGHYRPLGRIRTDAHGGAMLPAFQPTKKGTYVVRITPPRGRSYYLKVVVR